MQQAYCAIFLADPVQGQISVSPTTGYAEQSIHPLANYPKLVPAGSSSISSGMKLLLGLAQLEKKLFPAQHLQTLSSVSVFSSKTLLHDRRPSTVYLTYSLVSQQEWIDITVRNNLSAPIDLQLLEPRETVCLSGLEQHTLSGGPVWKGEDLFLEKMNSSSGDTGKIQLDVDLSFDMGLSPGLYEVFLETMGMPHVNKDKRTWRYFWTCVLKLQERSSFLLSLSGQIDRVTMYSLEKTHNLSLNIFWIETFNRKFKNLADVRPSHKTSRQGEGKDEFTHSGYIFDWSLEPEWHMFQNVFFAPYAFISYKQEPYRGTKMDYSGVRGTWIEANNLCAKFDGFLPIFRSKEELDHLLTLLKVPYQTPPPMPVIFIGLIKAKVSLLV